MNDQQKQIKASNNSPSEDELDSARHVYGALLLVFKNLSLYPHGHTICVNSIDQFYAHLTGFIQKYGNLKFEIERERVIAMGEIISSGPPEEGTLHFTFFRDGILWLEFMDGVEKKEINDFLMIINKYAKLSAEPDGDIVTALWEAHFPHIRYEVDEFSWGGDKEGGNSKSDLIKGNINCLHSRERNLEMAEPLSDPAIDESAVVISQQEQVILQEMIRQEEEADPTSYLDALLDSLLQHRVKENFSIILEVLSAEFTGSFGRRDFIVPLKILKGLYYVQDICKSDMPWATQTIEDFLLKASGTDSLAPLKEIWKEIDTGEAGMLGETFKLLRPRAVQTLVSLLPQAQPVPVRQMLLDSIIRLASQDIGLFESIMDSADGKLAERLVPVIVSLEGKLSLKYLLKLTRHPSARVRHEAVKCIFRRDPASVRETFSLIDDEDYSIRQLVLKQIGQAKDPVIEDLLLSYLQKTKFSRDDGHHLTECFRTLGKCGSSRSVPFLSETLLRYAWMPGLLRTTRRRGAAAALLALGIPEAEQVLIRAGRSLCPGLRDLVRKVRQES